MSKTNLKFLVVFILIGILLIGTIFALVKINKNESTKEILLYSQP